VVREMRGRAEATTMNAWVRSVDGLYNFIAYVVGYAPDSFPKEDFLPNGEQMNLQRAFEELRRGVALVEKDFPGSDAQRGLNHLLDEAMASYQAGDAQGAVTALHRFEAAIFSTSS
jgi:hypothetical protein